MSEYTEIQQLEIDYKKDILKINGEEIKNKRVLVSLPGPEGWERKKIFNHNLTTGNPGECEILEITFKKGKTGKVEELIEKLADHIIGIIDNSATYENEIEEKTRALAELVSAIDYIN